jgi:hypothetical protein
MKFRYGSSQGIDAMEDDAGDDLSFSKLLESIPAGECNKHVLYSFHINSVAY